MGGIKWSYGDSLAGGEEGLTLFTESSPVLDLALDNTGNCLSLWVATTATHINKWPADASGVNGYSVQGVGSSSSSEEEEEDVEITDIDDPTPLFTKPIARIPGEREREERKREREMILPLFQVAAVSRNTEC